MPKGTPAQKLAKAKHWINTYKDRIAAIQATADGRDKRKTAIRISELKRKIQLWQTQMCRWEQQRDETKPIRSIIRYAQTYFGSENFKFGVYANDKRMNLILFAKYMVENQYSGALAASLLSIHPSVLVKKRKMYRPETMSKEYQAFKKHIDERLSKKRQIRDARQSSAESRCQRPNDSDPQHMQSLRKAVS